jgi:hypothetical protein
MKLLTKLVTKITVLAAFGLVGFDATSGTVKIGNSNTGGDLENLEPVKEGIILESRQKALELVDALNIAGIPGLGTLRPEIEKTDLFLAKEDIRGITNDDLRPNHISKDGYVFARTLPEQYAATRFFPVALTLTMDQLVSLHIHEALHRALPESVRQEEGVVVQMNLAITTPGATHDDIRSLAAKLLPPPEKKLSIKDDIRPSFVGYGMRQFYRVDTSFYDIKRSHVLKSYLYPFGNGDEAYGLGLAFHIFEGSSGFKSGPIEMSFRYAAYTTRFFDVDFHFGASLNTLSDEELKESPFGRDVFSVGLSIRKEFERLYFENKLMLQFGTNSSKTIGNTEYVYDYGAIVEPSIHGGFVYGPYAIGAQLRYYLADEMTIRGGSFSEGIGRFRILTFGPEVRYMNKNFIASVSGKVVLDSTRGVSLSQLGLANEWAGKGGFELSAGYRF